MGNNRHGLDYDKNVDPNRCISQPAVLLKSANLPNEEAGECKDQAANGVAELELGHLRKCLAIGNDNDADVEKQLNRLQDVNRVAHWRPIYAKCNVSICSHRTANGQHPRNSGEGIKKPEVNILSKRIEPKEHVIEQPATAKVS